MNLSNPEKLILIMLSEIYEKLGIEGKSGIDPNFVKEAIYSGNTWGLEWEYTGVFETSEPPPPEVTETINYLDMWSFIEEAYEDMGEEKKKGLKDKAAPFGENVRFRGFDGNNEPEYIGITRFLLEHLGRFARFRDRELNSHMPSLTIYRRMYQVFEPIRRTLIDRRLSVDELSLILKAQHYRSAD